MKNISSFVIAFLIIGFFYLAMPEKGWGGTPALGCCISAEKNCIGCDGDLDCAIRGFDCPLQPEASFSSGEACLTFAGDDECKSLDDGMLGCCAISAGNCNDGESLGDCEREGDAWFLETDCSEVPECAPIPTNVPTLSEWGLVAMAGILGIVGFMLIRRKKVTA